MRETVILRALCLIFWVSMLSGAGCTSRQCVSHENCLRSCSCTDTTTNLVSECPVFFDCDVENRVCSDDYSMSCDEICGRYAARERCGSKVCVDDLDCGRQVVCEAYNSQTGALACTYTCDLTFGCDQTAGTCDILFGLEDVQLCASQLCPLPTDGTCG